MSISLGKDYMELAKAMTNKQIVDEIEINPNDWLEPYKPIPACEIKDCDHLIYSGNNVYGCRIAEDGLVCDDFNNADECCMYRQLEYYKEALKAKEQECERLKWYLNEIRYKELENQDIDFDLYEQDKHNTDYSSIITFVERALGEIDD